MLPFLYILDTETELIRVNSINFETHACTFCFVDSVEYQTHFSIRDDK